MMGALDSIRVPPSGPVARPAFGLMRLLAHQPSG